MNSAQMPEEEHDDDLDAVYGEEVARAVVLGEEKKFQPWHHPAKQFVRREQWRAQAIRLLSGYQPSDGRIRYLTLPGADMLDVRYIGYAVKEQGHVLEFLGFNTQLDAAEIKEPSSQLDAESVLRQEGLITDNSLTLPDRLQDIGLPKSQADNQLRKWRPFDIINLDVCGHFSDSLEAIDRLVQHQRVTDRPWLLLITTRVHPNHMGELTQHFESAIQSNLRLGDQFKESMAGLLEVEVGRVDDALREGWAQHNARFVKLYAVGLGKHLLHLCHKQVQDPARVELKSCLAYRIHGGVADMLSLAFLIQPQAKIAIPANADIAVQIQEIEVAHANQICRKASLLGDVDELIGVTLEQCAEETETLLATLNYDVGKYRQWVRDHPERPLALN